MAAKTERITFAGSGGEALAARLDTPPGNPGNRGKSPGDFSF